MNSTGQESGAAIQFSVMNVNNGVIKIKIASSNTMAILKFRTGNDYITMLYFNKRSLSIGKLSVFDFDFDIVYFKDYIRAAVYYPSIIKHHFAFFVNHE